MVTIGQIARNVLQQNPTMKNEEVLQLVKAEAVQQGHKDVQTSLACIAWYKSKMKKDATKQQVVIVRNLETVRNEIDATRSKLEELEAELQMMEEAEQEEQQRVATEAVSKLSKEQLEAILANMQ